MSSDRNKELFLKQVQQILDGIKQDRDSLGQRCSDERKERDRLNSSYLELIEKQRTYYKAVKDFQEVYFCVDYYLIMVNCDIGMSKE